ncbi:MAG: bifunctional folylpolyglutamate synthase/dihydrofolate synthase [Firmicutes bacterium]|nr:bifunctional folylpolyglutamate synthase/dihydrofolate synthase [Bacillota bacterium]
MLQMMNYLSALAEMKNLCSPAIKPGLERIEALLSELGHPEYGIRAVHVGGTNGKGSVCAMLDSIFLAAGCSTGRFTSPHLHDFRERCLINGEMLSEKQTATLLVRINEALKALIRRGGPLPTEFEASTALALLAMTEAKVDWAILEVGLGGRYDATNVVNAPIAIITNIGRDHMEYLGESIAEIAWEKAGIIKEGAEVFSGATGEALQVIEQEAASQKATICRLGQELLYSLLRHNDAEQYVKISTPCRVYKNMRLSLLGAHQGANAALAVAAAERVGLSEAAIYTGLAASQHPARLEIISYQPLIVLDGAHNVPAMAVLAQAVRDYWPKRRCLALIGMLADKERKQALAQITPYLSEVIISRPPLLYRSEDWALAADFCTDLQINIKPENIIEDIPTACAHALALLPKYDMMLVCGSLYLVAAVRAFMLERGICHEKNV